MCFCQAPCLTFHGVSDVAGGAQGPVSALLGQLGQEHTAQLIAGVVSLKNQQQQSPKWLYEEINKSRFIALTVLSLTSIHCMVLFI